MQSKIFEVVSTDPFLHSFALILSSLAIGTAEA